MARFPQDRFDELPHDIARVGAHRAPGRRGGGWVAFGWSVVAVAVLTAGGLFALSTLNPNLFPTASESPTPLPEVIETMDPVTDPSTIDPEALSGLTISVLNGTSTQGLAAVAAEQISSAGWPTPGAASADSTTEKETVVYYLDPANEGYARGIMQAIGAADVRRTDAFTLTAITVVLGSDYVPPAG
ncbi:LytR C-terminal domain-containing protein [Salinibacterium sp. ZJ77]|uniref:LytR C-terminal domain-containing protein n=1 Tax=Salinibacterium sp. ZJ77 TaxID=2708337 RepID=UPI001421F5A5|nr:LytR C-terminal domain-containing protein [Salinibacterium sp. ZJ77]